jgi:hypothetical protein
VDEKTLQAKFVALAPELTERSRRLWAATEAVALGHGGIALVERATGISRSTIVRGMRELGSGQTLGPGRTRRAGGGRKQAVEKDASLVGDLEQLVEQTESGDPESPLRWTSKSVRRLSGELAAGGHTASHRLVAKLLSDFGYSLQANRKTREGPSHPDRDAQFRYINDLVRRFQKKSQRRSWSGISRMRAENGGRKEVRNPSECTTSSSPSKAKPFPTGSTTCSATKAGSAWGSTTIRQASR